MGRWALISEGVVVNVIMWDGVGDAFSSFTTYAIPDDSPIGVGFLAKKNSGGDWAFTPPDLSPV